MFSHRFVRLPVACAHLLMAAAAVTGPAALRARAQTIVAVDEAGRRVFSNVVELHPRLAAKNGRPAQAGRGEKHHQRPLRAIERHAEELALQHRLDPRLVHAVIEVESAWNPVARSYKGAMGLMQLMPETAARLGVRNPFDAKENVEAGIRYLRSLLDRFGGDLRLALAAYNAGENAVDARGGIPPYAETTHYVERIATLYNRIKTDPNQNSHGIYQTVEGQRVVFVNY